ncbi:hypothetical protein BGZ60DRAFT_116320 [Tricladium varicosporioides]|nr:hypothetical protein BGZ60DRAFT_116320 [Hymenoscyphus varicosporioides]
MPRRPPIRVPPLAPTARLNPPNLTVRTSMRPPAYSTPRPQASSTSPPGHTSTSLEGVPKPIHPDKIEKALQLYIEYQRELYKEQLLKREPQSATRVHDGYHLCVPGTPTPRSVTSHTSSRRHRATSVSTSAYEGGTDISSLMSFDGNESPSASGRGKTEAVAYDGKTIVKNRTRRKLEPVTKAKAALVRWVGSCKTCNKRRVQCPLEHHDISILKRRLEESRMQSGTNYPYPTSPSNGNSPRNDATTPTGNTMAGISQGDDLLGLGQNEELLQTSGQFDSSHLEIASPGGQFQDPLAEISVPVPCPPSSDMDYLSQEFSSDPYSSYQHGDMLPIGVLRGNFFCQYRDGNCLQFFERAEDLLLHFECDHFAFTRIDPASRLVCGNCRHFNFSHNEPCFYCGDLNAMEVWIYGNYIRTPSLPRYPPSRQDLQMNSTGSVSYYPSSSYSGPAFDSQGDPGMDHGSFNGSYGNFNHQLDDTYAGSDMGSQGDYGGFGGSFNSAGPGSQYQGNMFARAWHSISRSAHSVQIHRSRKTRSYRYGRTIVLTLILFLAITFGFTYDSTFSAIRMALPKAISTFRAHLPAIGFVSILVSFTMYSSVRHIHQAGVQMSHSATHWPKPRHHYQNLPSKYFQCHGRQAPDAYVFGGRFS